MTKTMKCFVVLFAFVGTQLNAYTSKKPIVSLDAIATKKMLKEQRKERISGAQLQILEQAKQKRNEIKERKEALAFERARKKEMRTEQWTEIMQERAKKVKERQCSLEEQRKKNAESRVERMKAFALKRTETTKNKSQLAQERAQVKQETLQKRSKYLVIR